MAGYIFSINNIESLEESIYEGIYSTIINVPKNRIWRSNHEGTFADYITMKKGDNIYFFHQRKLYGIGELININGDCKFLNFPDADLPFLPDYEEVKHEMILNNSTEDMYKRMVCIFKGKPYFFKNGIDMDEVLSSNPDKFKMLRAFWKRSFIKIDDQENKALMDVILKNNEENLLQEKNIYKEQKSIHKRIKNYWMKRDQKNIKLMLMKYYQKWLVPKEV